MESETLETFEYQGQSMFIRLEEDTLDQDWLIVRAYYADGSLVNKFVYSVRKSLFKIFFIFAKARRGKPS